jgi:hypothetical protein
MSNVDNIMSVIAHPLPTVESDEMAMIVSRMYFGALTESVPWHCIWERQVQALRQNRARGADHRPG